MAEVKKNDLKIAGEGSVAGGEYNDVVINGAGRVTGDITCVALKMNGVGSADGAVKAESVTVNGSGTFSAKVETAEMTVNGDATVKAGLGVASLNVKGRLGVGGLAAREIDLRGELRCGNDLEAETLSGEGAFRVEGLVNVGEIDFSLHGKSSAREIGGERIKIMLGHDLVGASLLALFGDKRLTVESIEADEVSLESTTARVVRGGNVSIGSGCSIDLVEYTGTLNRMPDARIGEERHITVEEGHGRSVAAE